ncbi:neuropilin-1-like [Haliotis cracherodii]|uniref:neuropilin-1-like n=1 Tax=Haliotis cracherodii TaxID=6455 RepID=UPI0039E91E66
MANRCLCWCIGFMVLVYQSGCQESIDCDFESDVCAWNTSGVPWRRSNAGTDTPYTGPDSGRNGYYIYLEADDFKDNNQIVQRGKCVLLSPAFNTTSSGGCFRFWYHMKGSGIGNLSAAVVEGSPPSFTLKLDKEGPQGDAWKCGQFSLDENRNDIKIQLTAWSGLNIVGDIAVDDLKLFDTRCPAVCVDVTTTPTPTTSSLLGSTAVPASSSSQYTTVLSVDTTPTSESSDLTKTIIYISVIPVGVLLIGAAVACFCYRSRKEKKADLYTPDIQENHTNEGFHENGEEVYHDLDDATMLENVEGGYTMPLQILSSIHEGDTIECDYSTSGVAKVHDEGRAEDEDVADYTRLERHQIQEDTTSVDSNYIDSVAAPYDITYERTQEHENRDSLDTTCSPERQTDGNNVSCSPNWLSQHVPAPKTCGPSYITVIHEP